MTHTKPIRFWTAALALGVCAAAVAQGGRMLIMNGRSASRDVRMIGGKPYVPLADVARALGQQLVSRSGGYEIIWRSNSDTQTALTDTQGQSYPPIAYDMEESAPFQSKALLPGSSLDLGVLFVVPQGTVLKDLLFTLRTLDDKGHDIRVSLRQ